MRNFASITDDEVKTVYEKTPEVNLYHSWESVKKCEPLFVALKNSIIAHEQEDEMQNTNVEPAFIGIDLSNNESITALAKAPQVPHKEEIRRSTITLKENQIHQIRTAIKLARNCLMTDLGHQVREEAIHELSHAQSTMNSFFKR